MKIDRSDINYLASASQNLLHSLDSVDSTKRQASDEEGDVSINVDPVKLAKAVSHDDLSLSQRALVYSNGTVRLETGDGREPENVYQLLLKNLSQVFQQSIKLEKWIQELLEKASENVAQDSCHYETFQALKNALSLRPKALENNAPLIQF